MVWISNLGHSRFLALIVVERRLVALLFLMVGVFRLTTPLLRQWLVTHLRPLAGLQSSGGFGYLDAPPALSILEQPPWLALADGRGLCVLDTGALAAAGDCYIVMVWTSNLGQLRCFAFLTLFVVERRLVA